MNRDIESCFCPELSMTNIEFYVPLNNVSFVTTVCNGTSLMVGIGFQRFLKITEYPVENGAKMTSYRRRCDVNTSHRR